MKDSVQRQLNMQQGFLSLTQKEQELVQAYNEKYGTSYTVESAKEALGQ